MKPLWRALPVLSLWLGHAPAAPGLTLEECLAAAREANPSLEAAAQRVEAAAAAVDAARSGYYPTVTLAGSYARTDNPPQAFFMNLNQRQASLENDFNHPGDTENYRGSLAFRMLLLDAGQRGLSADMASRGADAARAMHEAAWNELAYQVARAYHSVHQAAALVTVREETIRSIEENLRVARERHEAGSAIKTDVLNLEVQRAEARENLVRAHNGLRLALAALNTAVGTEVARDAAALETTDAAVLNPPPGTVDRAEIEKRPELLAAALQADAAALETTRTRRDRMPRLNAYGSVDYDSDEPSGFEDSYLVGAMLEMDLFTGFRRKSDIAAAKALEMEARARQEQLRNQLEFDLTQSHLQATEAWERWQVIRQSLASSEEALRITRERYEQGAADVTELLTAQVGRTDTQSRTVAALYDYLISLANLDRARGNMASGDTKP